MLRKKKTKAKEENKKNELTISNPSSSSFGAVRRSTYTYSSSSTETSVTRSNTTYKSVFEDRRLTSPQLPRIEYLRSRLGSLQNDAIPSSSFSLSSPNYRSFPSTSQTASNNNSSAIPTYDKIKTGKVLIINNINFLEKGEERKGAEKDEENLNELFKKMNKFKVVKYKNLNAADLKKKIKYFSSSLNKEDISIVIVMSHGTNLKDNKEIRGGFTQILCIDNQFVAIDDILDEFNGDNCRKMNGKPKIFIFQCCRGDAGERFQTDGVLTRNVPKAHADMLIAYSTLPGFYSMRNPLTGTWYIQAICKVFSEHANEDVEHLLKIVDAELDKIHAGYAQTSTYECRGFKRCFLMNG